jgi:uncharacterized protein (DUF488 family)
MRIWTVGHSTHGFDEFVDLLATHGITLLADVRTVPRSRRHPQFHAEALARSLPGRGVKYVHVPDLGGWRRPTQGSPNSGWRNESFRGYADYAMGQGFAAGLSRLRELAAAERVAIMCSEALWWRCHRRLVADRLVVTGDVVCHIGPDGRASEHELTPFAVVGADGQITYPPAP